MNRKRIIFGSICVILLVALVSGTLAWFYINEEVTVSYGNSIFCEAGDSLEIALVENGTPGRWSSSIDYSHADDFTIVDISGDGFNLFRPKEIDENQEPVDLVNLKDSPSRDYVELEIAFRSIAKMNVYLSGESFIDPVDTEKTGNMYGDFSKDYIAGAMRVAVIDESAESDADKVKMIWAPNSQYELVQGIGYLNAEYALLTNSTNPQSYAYYAEDENGEAVKRDVPAEWFANKKYVVDSTGANREENISGNSPVLVSLNPKEGEHDQKTVKIRIWFEGTDREAHQALAGGNVKVQLKFIGIAKKDNVDAQTAIDNLDSATFTGLADGMVCSIDGRTWQNVLPDNLESGSAIFVKYPETDEYYETRCKMITMN